MEWGIMKCNMAKNLFLQTCEVLNIPQTQKSFLEMIKTKTDIHTPKCI